MTRVIIFGGNGFVGSEIVNQLKDFDVYTIGRGETKGRNISANILDKKSIKKAIKNNDIVINMVGLTPTRKPRSVSYEDIHVKGAKNIVETCKKKNCRLIHMSALGANINGETEYLRTKGKGEKLVLESGLKVNVFCPSIIFDKNNELIELMNKLSFTRFFPDIPAKVQPVYRKDIAKFFVLAVKGEIKEKKIEIGGPEVFSVFEMARLFNKAKGRKCFPIPLFFVRFIMNFARLLHIKGIGKDQIINLKLDNVTKSKETYTTVTKFSEWVKK